MPKADIKVLKPIPHYRTHKSGKGGHQVGEIITVTVDRQGTPINRWWRDRLKDAAIDGCCEIVKKSKPTSKPAGDDK